MVSPFGLAHFVEGLFYEFHDSVDLPLRVVVNTDMQDLLIVIIFTFSCV